MGKPQAISNYDQAQLKRLKQALFAKIQVSNKHQHTLVELLVERVYLTGKQSTYFDLAESGVIGMNVRDKGCYNALNERIQSLTDEIDSNGH